MASNWSPKWAVNSRRPASPRSRSHVNLSPQNTLCLICCGTLEHVPDHARRIRRSRRFTKRDERPGPLPLVQPGGPTAAFHVLFGLVRARMAAPFRPRLPA